MWKQHGGIIHYMVVFQRHANHFFTQVDAHGHWPEYHLPHSAFAHLVDILLHIHRELCFPGHKDYVFPAKDTPFSITIHACVFLVGILKLPIHMDLCSSLLDGESAKTRRTNSI